MRCGRFEADAADIGEHFAGGVVEHDDRTVAHAVRAEARELAAQRDDRGGLDAAVDGGGDALAGLVEQADREVGGEPRIEARGMLARDERCGGGADCGAVLWRPGIIPGNTACAAAERLGARGRGGKQPGEERGVGATHLGGFLAEQALRARADALRFAAQGQEVEIGFEHLLVRPVCRERLSGAHLAELGPPVAFAGLSQTGVEEGGELHRQRRGAARAVAGPARSDGARDGKPVDAAVRPETAVLALHHGAADGRADVLEWHPCETAVFEIDALAVEQLAVAVVEPCFAWAPVGAYLFEGRHRGRSRREMRGGDKDKRRERRPCENMGPAPPAPGNGRQAHRITV